MENVSFCQDVAQLHKRIAELLPGYSMVFVLCDEHTEEDCLPLIKAALDHCIIITIASGETAKNIHTCEYIWEKMTEQVADRKTLLINLGGGVITDMGGFAASCYKRGIDFINIPTTLLAMVDAAVGGKTGIDFNNYKNQIGVFSEARAVLICMDFLRTLDERQVRSGMAEVVKHYLIADADAFIKIIDSVLDMELIQKAIAIKSHIVAQDPFEKNIRKALNFGHTLGHAIESYMLDTDEPLLHGEAVAVGMAIEILISEEKGLLPADTARMIVSRLRALFELKPLDKDIAQHLQPLIMQDKKNENRVVKMTLLESIGLYKIDVTVEIPEIKAAIDVYNRSLPA